MGRLKKIVKMGEERPDLSEKHERVGETGRVILNLIKKLGVLGTLEQDGDKNFGVKVQQQMAVSLRMKVSESQGTLDQIRRNFRPIRDKEV